MTKKAEILQQLQNQGDRKVKVALCDIDGILRGKIIHTDKFLEAAQSSLGFCDVVFGWDAQDLSYDRVNYTGWHTGYPDAPLYLDLETYRRQPWDGDIPFFLGDLQNPEICPRSLLRKICQNCKDMGFGTRFSQEFEWFNFENTPQDLEKSNFQSLKPITPGMFGYSMLRPTLKQDFFNVLFDQLENFDVQLEGLHTETGPGVYEAAIRYDEVLNAADKAVLFKNSVKEIAYSHGILASFMAKWNTRLPGCGGHIHQSLWNIGFTQNLFYDENKPFQMSDLFQNYAAGLLHCLPHILPMYAPTVNSYKRLTEGAWAPTTQTWGIDNRTTAIRVLNNKESSCRTEMRVAGADTNPYLAMAACLASGLYGIRHKLALDLPPTQGNGYQEIGLGRLAPNLGEAAQFMQNSEIAQELFGEAFVDHFTQTRFWEWRQFLQQVTDWELKRYLEII
ncbi:MAG: glutamine synthetase family protein [Microscillaceae bacterium]|nr:glutamine synthetase family protein [Microscillaceae bacterium]